MIGKIYKNTSDNITVNKNISQLGSNLTLSMKEDTDIINPTIFISRTINMKTANYLYIQDLNRYYFINSIETSQQYYILHCTVDVLMSYKGQILSQWAIVSRNANRTKMYLQDEKLKLYNVTRYEPIPFPSGFYQSGSKVSSFVLTLNGGGNI